MNWCHRTGAVSDKTSYKMAAADSGSEKKKKKRKKTKNKKAKSKSRLWGSNLSSAKSLENSK